ncbi:hypothetical protein F4679DRAFT_599774 [Xylaria curta]|nr:hypothetical protein F4679DRAFT_599774 [Xylaria curta]
MSANPAPVNPFPMPGMAAMNALPAGGQGIREFVPQVHGFTHAFQKRLELIATRNIPGERIPIDMPRNDNDRRFLVERLWNAMFNLVDVAEAPTSQHYKYMVDGPNSKGEIEHHYPSDVVETMCWCLLWHVEEAEYGRCHVPYWFCTEGPTYKAYPSFNDRFHAVETALKESKSCCCSIFSFSDFSARLAWNPAKEHKRKGSNRTLNSVKNKIQTIGSHVMHESDVKVNDTGVLEDKASNGKQYVGKKKLEAAHTVENNGVAKRTRRSKRSNLAQRLADPNVGPKIENEIFQIQGAPATASGSRTPSAPTCFGMIGVFDPRRPLTDLADVVANRTPARAIMPAPAAAPPMAPARALMPAPAMAPPMAPARAPRDNFANENIVQHNGFVNNDLVNNGFINNNSFLDNNQLPNNNQFLDPVLHNQRLFDPILEDNRLFENNEVPENNRIFNNNIFEDNNIPENNDIFNDFVEGQFNEQPNPDFLDLLGQDDGQYGVQE